MNIALYCYSQNCYKQKCKMQKSTLKSPFKTVHNIDQKCALCPDSKKKIGFLVFGHKIYIFICQRPLNPLKSSERPPKVIHCYCYSSVRTKVHVISSWEKGGNLVRVSRFRAPDITVWCHFADVIGLKSHSIAKFTKNHIVCKKSHRVYRVHNTSALKLMILFS